MQPQMKKTLSAALGCAMLGCASIALGASGIPTLHEQSESARGDLRPDFMQRFAIRGFAESRANFDFQHFADLFLSDDDLSEHDGIAWNITAAVFGESETHQGGFVFGDRTFVPVTTGAFPTLNSSPGDSGQFIARSAPVAADLPAGGGGGISAGTGGGGGGTAATVEVPGGSGGSATAPSGGGGGGGQGTPADDPGDETESEKLITFSDNPPHGNGCCCCCPGFNNGIVTNGKNASGYHENNGGSATPDHGPTAAIPLPPSLWLGLVGLAAIGWMRQRRVV